MSGSVTRCSEHSTDILPDTLGVIGIDNDRIGPILTPDQRRLLDALVDQG
jgi:hypothetical protein